MTSRYARTDRRCDFGQSPVVVNLPALYARARVHRSNYRDFSASRREIRAQFRQRILNGQAKTGGKAEGHESAGLGALRLNEPPPIPAEFLGESPAASLESRDSGPFPAGQSARSADEGSAAQEAPEPFSPKLQPQWLDAPGGSPPLGEPAMETLLDAQERIASRWFVLQSVFVTGGAPEPPPPVPAMHASIPSLAIFSIAGGVGKTTLTASLGRAFAFYGERVLLADATSSGLLPFYFGSREVRPGTVRVFSPPEGSGHAPVLAVTLTPAFTLSGETERAPEEGNVQGNAGGSTESKPDPWVEELRRGSHGVHRLVIDVQTADRAAALRFLPLAPAVLVPLLADMNSVVSVASVEAAFLGREDASGRTVQPLYLLNQFDPSVPLHVDVREILRRRLGDRLLPFVVRRSPAVSEALAEGMTVMDYVPTDPVAGDCLRLASFLRSLSSAAVMPAREQARWSEQ